MAQPGALRLKAFHGAGWGHYCHWPRLSSHLKAQLVEDPVLSH